MFLLHSGVAKVRRYTRDGEEVVLSLLGPGELLGEMAALGRRPRAADMVTISPVSLVRFNATSFSR